MNLTAKNILRKAGLQPLKRFGQNFLTDKKAIDRMVEAGQISPSDIILEVGPGTGILTVELAKRAGRVIAVEKDKRMCGILEKTLQGFDNVAIVNEDIRKTPEIRQRKYKVMANLPFYLSAPLIRKFLESRNRPEQMILIVQKEVAQRISSKVPDMNLLAVSVQFYATPKIISSIPKKSFWPQPEVDAAIIKITPKKILPDISPEKFFSVVKAGFSQPRKQLLNNLSRKLGRKKEKVKAWLEKNGIQPKQRAETLAVEDWVSLAKTL